MQDQKTKTGVIRNCGPLVFIAEQAVKRLERAALPAFYRCGRDPAAIQIRSKCDHQDQKHFVEMVGVMARVISKEYRCKVNVDGSWLSLGESSATLRQELV